MKRFLLLATLLAAPANAIPVTPNFTTGTTTSFTQATTTVNEKIRQVDYNIGESYTVSGTNINLPGSPSIDNADYTMAIPGDPFQFSETYFGAGMSRETFIDRTTIIQTNTETTSVFSQ